jgi:hypothetical protein
VVGVVGIVLVVSPSNPFRRRKGEIFSSRGGWEAVRGKVLSDFVGRADGQTDRGESGVSAERSGDDTVASDVEVRELPDLRVEVGNCHVDVGTSKNVYQVLAIGTIRWFLPQSSANGTAEVQSEARTYSTRSGSALSFVTVDPIGLTS